MKGLTSQLKSLVIGERLIVTGTERSDIHKTAKRADVKVKIEKFVGGFYVTRTGVTVLKDSIQFATSVENAEAGKFIEINSGEDS